MPFVKLLGPPGQEIRWDSAAEKMRDPSSSGLGFNAKEKSGLLEISLRSQAFMDHTATDRAFDAGLGSQDLGSHLSCPSWKRERNEELVEDQSRRLNPVGKSCSLPQVGVLRSDSPEEWGHEEGKEDRF